MLEKKTILIVDDTETNVDVLLDILDERYDLLVALDGETALEILREEKIDLILLDIMMPDMDGYEVCQSLKADVVTQDIPVIFITAKTDEDSIEKAYEVGGVDYISKPFKPRELLVRVKTQLKLMEVVNHLEFIASHDAMTGIYNRRKFFELANDKFDNSKKDLCAVMIDIDKFKRVNDTYGHAMGDKVIKIVTKTISEHMPEGAIFGRMGGEEFALVYHCDSKEKVIRDLDSLRLKVAALELFVESNVSVKCTISEGISKVTSQTKNLDELLKEADKALYEAKDRGRDRVIFR